ncbi:hypothetical protein [Burkholderia contaminans]|uniref:hypothetical protein n=1 Tax=Burkholderia contaminans TaxID=488447 RepID=UPI0015836E67|nr:hypothetical protein [Burkholderia contaminans]
MKLEGAVYKASVLAAFTLTSIMICSMRVAGAAELDIKAAAKPSVLHPSNAKFEMTIPADGWCGQYSCPSGYYVRKTPLTAVNRKIDAKSSDARLWTYFGGDARWRDVEVRSSDGETYTVRLRLVLFTQNMRGVNSHNLVQPGVYGMGSSRAKGAVGHGGFVHFAIRTPETNSMVTCSRKPADGYANDHIVVKAYDMGFQFIFPNPLSMPNGKYVGQTTYTVGNTDLDFGEAVYSDDRLTFNLELDVEHQFELKIPPGSERAVLEPPHGWVQWLNRGKPPTRLRRDVPFALSGSMPFAMTLRCSDRAAGEDACVIREPRGSEAPLQVSVSVPGTATSSGRPVVRLPLTPDVRLGVEPNGYLNNAQSRLHIEVDEVGVDEMVRHPGSEYRGNVMVVFDAMAD